MNELQDIISFGYGTGLNWDDDPALMPKGDGKYRKNIDIESDSHHGVPVRTRGNNQKKTVIDPVAMSSWSESVVGDYTRYSAFVSNDSLYASGVLSSAGVVINIKTDNGTYKIYHKNTFTTLLSGCTNLESRIEELGDTLIGPVSYTIGGSSSTFTIDILTASISKGVQYFAFVYGDAGYLNAYMANKEIVGTYYHAKDNELYCFWAYDSNGYTAPWSDNLITVYKYNEGLIEVLNSEYLTIPSTIAKWNKNNPIKAVIVGDGDDKLLYWVDGVNGIMKVNVNTAINTTYGYYGSQYADHDSGANHEEALSVAKIIPDGVYFVQEDALSREANIEIIKYPCQFMLRYIFDDYEKSAWSDVSFLSGFDKETAMGYIHDSAHYFGSRLSSDTAQTNTVKYVEVAFRKTLSDTWKIFKTQEDNVLDYIFTGYEQYTDVADSEANKLFENIPIQSGVITVLPSGHLVFGDNTIGYPNVTLDVTVEAETTSTFPTTVDIPEYIAFTTASSITKTLSLATFTQTGQFYVTIKTTSGSYVIPMNYASSGAFETIASYINENITELTAVGSGDTLTITHDAGAWISGYGCSFPTYAKSDNAKIKNGSTHYTCIFYYDKAGRMCYAQPLDPIYIPFYTEQTTYTNNEYLDVIKLTVAHQPPTWAHSWGIGYGLSNIYGYKQILLKVSDFVRENNTLKIQYNSVLDLTYEFLPNFNLSYQFTKGDRIRWIGTLGTYTASSGNTANRITLLSDYIDDEVLGVDGEWTEYLVVPDYRARNIADGPTIDAASYVLVELYTPRRGVETTFYYETPYKFDVNNPETSSRYHSVNSDILTLPTEYGITTVSQDATHDAVCYLSKMDFVLQQFWAFDDGVPISCYVDSEHFSNYFDSKMKSIGRPHIENKDARQVRLNNLIWTNAYIPDTRVNGLSSANFESELKVDDKFGRITGLEVAGDILTVVQQSKISSVYLGAELALDASGNQTLSYTGNVLGSIRPRAENYGSDFKESILRVGQNIYGFDLPSAVVWRTDYNGTQNLTDYSRKMKSYITAKSKALMESGVDNIIVVTGFDFSKQLFYITFRDLSDSTNNETLAFHEPTNRWVSFYDFIPDMYASIESMQFLTIKSGYLYEHDSATATRGNFYGTTYTSEIWATCNQYPSEIKVWNSLKEDANAVWDMPDNDSIVVDEEDIEYTNSVDYTRHKSGMQSRLKSGRFRYKNGMFHAAFLNDMTTNSTSATQYDLFTGRKLRGRYITMKFENDDDAAVYLRSIQVNGQKSN
jgi:hypothetical protein